MLLGDKLNNKILLISPSLPITDSNRDGYIPLGLLYIASVLRKINVEVDFIDLNMSSPEDIFDNINSNQPDIVGIGCWLSCQFEEVFNIAKDIKNIKNGIKIITGGIHPTAYYKEILSNCNYFDYIVLGEGENTVVDLIKLFRGEIHNVENIEGVAYKDNGNIIYNPLKKLIHSLDELPFPSYDILNISDYYCDASKWNNPKNLPINFSVPLFTSRGCGVGCNFCLNFMTMGRKWRSRNYINVVDEMEYMHDKYSCNHFSFMDDNLTFNKKRTINICKEIMKRKMNIHFETPNGIYINTLDEEVLDAMVEAGLTRLSLAIESGSDYIRNDVMGKNIKRDKIYDVIDITKKYEDLIVRTFYIIGMPEDSNETLGDTYEMIKRNDVDIPIVSNLMPYRGGKVFEQCKRDKLILKDININKLWINNDFYLSNKRFFIKPYDLTIEELKTWRKEIDILINEIVRKHDKKRLIRKS